MGSGTASITGVKNKNFFSRNVYHNFHEASLSPSNRIKLNLQQRHHSFSSSPSTFSDPPSQLLFDQVFPSKSRLKELLNVLESFDVELVLVRGAQFDDLFREITGNAPIVEHVHEEVVKITVDDVCAGNVLSGRIVAASVVNVKLFDFKSVLLFRLFRLRHRFFYEGTKESKSLTPPRQVHLELGFGFEIFVLRRLCLFHLGISLVFDRIVDIELDDNFLAIVVLGKRDFAAGDIRLKTFDSGKDVVNLSILLQIDFLRQKFGQFLIALGQVFVHRARAAEEMALRESEAAVLNTDFRGDSI